MGREIKRVALDFDWPLSQVWKGYLMPDTLNEKECVLCRGTGYSPYAQRIHNKWYGYTPFSPIESGSEYLNASTPVVRRFAERNIANAPEFYGTSEQAIFNESKRLANMWNSQLCHHLTQEDVDALIADERLVDFTHNWSRESGWVVKDPMPEITAAQVNEWSMSGMGHDSINQWVVVKARCERMGVSATCGLCGGHGSVEAYEGQRAQTDAWEPTEPPAGTGWQVWETVSEGSPISPVFADREELIAWLMSDEYRIGISVPLTRTQAENFVESAWAPTMIVIGGEVLNGEQYIND